jgi:hypothetical protein
MARRETGAWLPISAVVAGLALYGAGIAILELGAGPHTPMYVFAVGLAAIVIGLLLLPAVCAWGNPWWRFSGAAVYLFSAQFLLFQCIPLVHIWRLKHTPQWELFGWALALCASVWTGYREILKARKEVLAAKVAGESH